MFQYRRARCTAQGPRKDVEICDEALLLAAIRQIERGDKNQSYNTESGRKRGPQIKQG